jgi:hypothetical protein
LLLDNRNTSLSDGEVKFFEDVNLPVIQQEPRITTPNLNVPTGTIVNNQPQNVVSTVTGYNASLPTAERA